MISYDSLPDIHWFYYCYIVIHRRGDTSPHLLLFYRISWVYRRVSPLLWTITSSCISAWCSGEIKGDNIVSGKWCGEKVKRWKGEIVVFSSNVNRVSRMRARARFLYSGKNIFYFIKYKLYTIHTHSQNRASHCTAWKTALGLSIQHFNNSARKFKNSRFHIFTISQIHTSSTVNYT